jgi:hypothetical protein
MAAFFAFREERHTRLRFFLGMCTGASMEIRADEIGLLGWREAAPLGLPAAVKRLGMWAVWAG